MYYLELFSYHRGGFTITHGVFIFAQRSEVTCGTTTHTVLDMKVVLRWFELVETVFKQHKFASNAKEAG